MGKEEAPEVLLVGGREVPVTHPSKLYFSQGAQLSKLDIVRYYLAIGEGAVRAIRDRPIVLKRYVDGAEKEPFYQKRAPDKRPDWLRTVTLSFPSGRTAEEVVVDDVAGLCWVVNLGCIELHPHPVRAGLLDCPDELRVDLDPGPGVAWDDVRKVALEVRAVLDELGLVGWPKTSGSRGMHVNVRIEPKWSFTEVRRAALALSREVERRAPSIATSKWWKEERRGVFLDYNQNAKDRTTCSAYSVRAVEGARVSAPLSWDEVATCDLRDFTVSTMPERFARVGDLHAGMDQAAGSLGKLFELSQRDEATGLGDAPWPPHYRKADGEAPRVAPSRKKSESAGAPRAARASKAAPSADGAPKVDGAPKAGRTPKMPLLVIANSPSKEAALQGLERWKTRHPDVAALLALEDVLVDSMRGRSSTWTRIRVNLKNVPLEQRPPQEPPDPDDDPTRVWREKWRAAKQG